MVAHEEGVVGRDSGTQKLNRRLIIRRPIGELDERLLARQRLKHGFLPGALRQLRRKTQARGLSLRLGYESLGYESLGYGSPRQVAARNRDDCARACRFEQAATCDHSISPSAAPPFLKYGVVDAASNLRDIISQVL